MRFFYTAILIAACFVSAAQTIPNDLIVSREPRPELKVTERAFTLASLSNGWTEDVFATPFCLPGEYYVAFQLYYDLGNVNTEIDWTSDIRIAFLNDTTTQWTKDLSLQNITQTGPSPSQTFVQTAFHSTVLSCNPIHKIKMRWKNASASAPQSNISLKILYYKKEDYVANPFNPATTSTVTVPTTSSEKNLLSWNYEGPAVVAYDVEWVYIASHETKYTGTTAAQAFQFKEPARVTVASAPYVHSAHYPDGKLWYRVRAVGYNPLYPEHRINGAWSYGPNAGLAVINHAPQLTWQSQSVYAEQGKYKKIMTYYDGTLRQRQQQTNLSTSGDTTLVGESLYDYEGRASISIMAVPAASTSLGYKPSFNVFQTSTDPTVAANTSAAKRKFNYDNGSLPNSVMATTSGASKYYSPANDLVTFRRNYIPDAEGFVYSQTEFTNDGTGKVKRQSGVGKEFRMDGPHMSKYYYGQATQTELDRLFGSNVGNAAHYKKNLVVDNNGQASVSYLDQEGRVVATALAGAKPDNVASLPSYDALSSGATQESITRKNVLVNGEKVITHKILNVANNTEFTFNYNLSATGPELTEFGCVECTFDLRISITDPEGKLLVLDLPTHIPGNEDDTTYLKTGISVAACQTTPLSVQFTVVFQEVGDYTVTKILTPHNTEYSDLKTIIEAHQSVILKKQKIVTEHAVDSTNCDVCVSGCPETEGIIDSTINEIAAQDCDNKLRLIIQALRDQHPDDPEYQPTQIEIEGHPDFCDYELCLGTKESDAFEKKLARISGWSAALVAHYEDLANVAITPYPDPFFRNGALGSAYTAALQNELSNIFVATIAFDTNADGVEDGTQDYYGAILDVINPLNPDLYIDEDGNATGSVNSGHHILYLDVMRRYDANELTLAQYNEEVNKLRWTFFKSFYLEAKRKTKLGISDFTNCPAAKAMLEMPATLPTTEGGVRDYGDEQGINKPLSEPELESYFASFKFKCSDQNISEADSLLIIDHLTSYFNGKPPGLFKLILSADINTDPDLQAIQEIFNDYGCGSLSYFGDVDPFSCAKDTTITYRNKYVEQTQGSQSSMMVFEDPNSVEGRALRMQSDSISRIAFAKMDSVINGRRDEALKVIDAGANLTMQDIKIPPAQTDIKLSTSPSKNLRSVPGPVKSLVTTTTEYNALMAIYNATGGPNWVNKVGWGDVNAPTWYGVGLDANGHVVSLVLPWNNLVGTLPAAIADLTYLTELILAGNPLSGSFPTPVCSLTSLTRLNLAATQLSGPLPATFTDLVNLVDVDLQINALSGPIPSDIGDLNKLTRLILRSNQFSGQIPASIGSLVELKELFVDTNLLSGSLPPQITSLTKLQELHFNHNSISGSIPADIGNMKELVRLYGYANMMTGTIPPSIRNLTKLTSFHFGGNQLTGAIPSAIGKLTALQTLALYSNQLTGPIPDSIGYLTNLTQIFLHQNQLTGSLPSTMGMLTKVGELYIHTNQLSGPLPSTIGNMKELFIISLTSNSINGPLPSTIGQLKKLSVLYIDSNEFSGSLPPEIGGLEQLQILALQDNQFSGSIPGEIGQLKNLTHFLVHQNNFTGPIPASIGNLNQLLYLYGHTNNFSGPLPSSIGNLTNLLQINLNQNKISGPLPASLGQMTSLQMLALGINEITGPLPTTIGSMSSLNYLDIGYNKITGSIPSSFANLTNLQIFTAHSNRLTGDLASSFTGLNPNTVNLMANKFTFKNLLPLKQQLSGTTFSYASQDSVDTKRTITVLSGSSITLTTKIDRQTQPKSLYRWYQIHNNVITQLNGPDTAAHTLTLTNLQFADNGKRFFYVITNPDGGDLALYSRMRKLIIDTDSIKTVTICLEPDTANTTMKKFKFVANWSEVVENCLKDAEKEKEILVNIAVQRLIDSVATSYLIEQKTNCISGTTEAFTFTFVKREHHYTLYYYDQAGNLVQTVPPEGVHPTAGVGEPAHTMITRYQYNSLNQVIWQKTPDAGESQFWHNDKGQVRMSQNAQQFKDRTYSYTKYDAQGRVAESGEITNTTADISVLVAAIETTAFPQANTYALTDVSKIHYDVADAGISTFVQDNVRNRVSWVEILEEGQSQPVVTAYSYDIHGSVKSLLQRIPGLEDKRTDYAYDFISGNVNYVFYQYGKTDQFIHRYKFDAGNRLAEVRTSSDGYFWDIDARYRYYLHGPLARVELGHHRVQALDYYYTLHGWLKGVNMPYADDPGGDGSAGTNLRVSRDAFAYTLGYYENDYNPIVGGLVVADLRDQLWTRYKSLMGSTNTGLYNTNIAWMITDLEKIGDINSTRTKGMQAMLYQYDQLQRIRQSRSLANYTEGSGFDTRTTSPAAYDEDFTYDDNGNIMTLQRRDQTGAMLDDFTYDYYDNTNKLQYHDVVTRNITFNDAIPNDNKVYSTITIGNNAYVPAGQNVTIRATTAIEFDETPPSFDLQSGATFHAHLMDETEGEYEYDAIGNLITDHETGVNIDWTPNGKISRVTKGDGTVTTFRYDAVGNRIEKKIVTAANETTLTRYIMDASGNVIGVYNDQAVLEHQIYGSTRLGMNVVGRLVGERKLGGKRFELSNHLRNVLTVITDNIRMSSTATWAHVASTTDYYAFGSNMAGRSWQNDYRYGLNGKEKDPSNEVGSVQYDYGFRIYNPSIGRFLSADPLAKSFPWNSPYSYAENDVMRCIDLDGLEKVVYLIYIDHANKSVMKTKIELETAGKLGKGIAVMVNICSDEKEVEYYFYGSGTDKKNLKDFVTAYEGNRLQVYHGELDEPGKLTVGIGHLVAGPDDEAYFTEGCFITNEESIELFEKDMARITKLVAKNIGKEWEDLDKNEKDAMTDLGYNKGPKRTSEFDNTSYFIFSFYKRHPADRTPGIIKRRVGEFLLYEEGSYYHFEWEKKKARKKIIQNIVDDYYNPEPSGTDPTPAPTNRTPNTLSPNGTKNP
jgi:RHS repeat-associated protein